MTSAFPTDLHEDFPIEFRLVASAQLNGPAVEFRHTITLYLYRVTVDPQRRNSAIPTSAVDEVVPLSLDLHYLLSVWGDSALEEHTVLGWVMQELQQHQAMSPSDLSPEAEWSPDDIIQIVPNEISNEDMMRIWDALDPGYRLSVSYIARVVPISAASTSSGRPVVSRGFITGGLSGRIEENP